MASFTTFAFDGLKRKRRTTKRRATATKRRSSSLRGYGRIKRGAKRPMEKVCGCKVSSVRSKGGRRQATLVCPGTPMRKFISEEQAAKIGRGTACTKVLKPLR